MSLADTAQRLIQANGRTVTLHLSGAAPSESDKPWRGARSDPETHPGATLDIIAVYVKATEGELARSLFAALTGGSGVPPRRGRDTFIIAGLDLGATDPSTIDAVTDTEQEWRVTGVEIIKPGDTLYAAILEVRQ